MFFVTAPLLDTTGWSAAALAQIEKIQHKERERQKKEEDMRLLQLKATSSKKRSSDEIPEQLEKRVRPKIMFYCSNHNLLFSLSLPSPVQDDGKEHGQALGGAETHREISTRAG